jgi:hypothetical protein
MNHPLPIRIPLFLGMIALLALSGMGCEGETVRGSGVMKTESRDVKDFSVIECTGSGDVRVERGETDSLTVEADDNILPLIETTVKDGKLKLKTKNNVNVSTTKPISYRITARQLHGVTIAGAGDVATTNVEAKSFAITIAGSGNVSASGTTDSLDITITGSGSVDAIRMPAKTVKAVVTGEGRITVSASEKLEANIVGDGSIDYVGNPQVTKRVVGSGRVSAKPNE